MFAKTEEFFFYFIPVSIIPECAQANTISTAWNTVEIKSLEIIIIINANGARYIIPRGKRAVDARVSLNVSLTLLMLLYHLHNRTSARGEQCRGPKRLIN